MLRITKLLALIGAGAYLVAVSFTMLDILLRSMGLGTVHGVTDLTELCVIAGAMLAIPYVFMTDQHVAINLFTDKLPAATQIGLRICASILGIIFLAGVLWFSAHQAISDYFAGDRSQTIGIPMVWYWLPFLVGVALSVAATIAQGIFLIHRRKLPANENDEVTL